MMSETSWLPQLGWAGECGTGISWVETRVMLNILQCAGQTHNKDLSDPEFQLCRGCKILFQSMTIFIWARKKNVSEFYENTQPGDLPWSGEGFLEERPFELRHEE